MSPETLEKLEVYHALLLKWQDKINLISPNTIPTAWERHFVDSMQLERFVSSSSKTLLDLGSGAGFPGLVLAIMRPDIKVHLVESDSKKCSFLKTVSRETDIPVFIHNTRIESVSRETDIKPDIIMARALASLSQLLSYTEIWITKERNIRMIYPKGIKASEELEDARLQYNFSCTTYPSETEKEAQILVLEDISRCE